MSLATDLSSFLWEHCTYFHEKETRERVEEVVKKHLEYMTLVCLWDDKGFTGVCTFDIDGDVCKVHDVAVRPDKRRSNTLQQLLKKGLATWPHVKTLSFHSQDKDRNFEVSTDLVLAKDLEKERK